MNKKKLQGHWEEIKDKLKQTWGKLTEDDMEEIKGNQLELFGKLQRHYGYTKEEAKKAVEEFLNYHRD